MNRAIAAVLVAALMAACGQGARTGTPSSEPSASPSPSVALATPTVAPSPTPQASEGPVSLRFERVVNVHRIAELRAIAAFDGGYVAGGCRLRPPSGDGTEGGCASAYTLLSRDGSTWTEVPVPDPTDVNVLGLSNTPFGVLAFGTTLRPEPPQSRAIWQLAGDRWEVFAMPAPSSIVFRTALPVNGRTVFLGSDTTYDLAVETEAWSTVDGTSWSTGSTPLSPKIAAAPGLVAVGDECVDVCEPNSQTHVYRSTDAFTWTEDQVSPDLESSGVAAIATWNGRAIIGGSTQSGVETAAAVWLDEATGWRPVALPNGMGYTVAELIVSAHGAIAIAPSNSDQPPAVWWSPDAMLWTPVRLEGIAQGYIVASAGEDPLFVIVDYDSIWVSEP